MLSMILKYDNEALKKRCVDVAVSSDVSETIKTMKKVLGCSDNGVGLAASQIGILDRIIVVRSDVKKYAIKVMINPEIISHSEEKKYGIEGCLSFPRTYAPVERYAWVEVKYFDENWKEQTFKSKLGTIDGIVLQHEIEHLLEGNCQIHDWWEDMEGKQKELQEIFESAGAKTEEAVSSYEVEESEDMKREKAEAVATAE
jgi:peptide deformylase